MMTQTEMFAKSEIDDAKLVLAKLQSDWEKADKAVAAAEDKRDYIHFLVGKQEGVIERLKVNTTIEIRELEPIVVVDEETGEVAGGAEIVDDGELEPQHVFVVRPGSSDVVETLVGPYTRFSELVADYITESGGDQDIADFAVYCVGDHSPRPLNAIIREVDYGLAFTVEPCTKAGEGAEAAS